MKKLIILIIALNILSLISCFAVNWCPFIPGQVSYYKIVNYYDYLNKYNDLKGISKDNLLTIKDRILAVETDTLFKVMDGDTTFFLINPLRAIENYKCYNNILLKKNSDPGSFSLLIDSFKVLKDKIILFEKKAGWNKYFKLEIPLFSEKGDSIVEVDYTIKYLNIQKQEIFTGILDSVMTYSIAYKGNILEECTFKLSKNFGIVYYEVYDSYSHGTVPLELIGVKDNEKTLGITNSEIWDSNNFFTLKKGDTKYWLYEYNKDGIPLCYDKFLKDSLVEIKENDEIISFKFDRYEYEYGKMNKIPHFENYEKEKLQKILENPTGSVFVMKLPNSNSYDFESFDRILISGNYVRFDEKIIDNSDWGYFFISQHELSYPPDSCNFSGSLTTKMMFFPKIGLAYERFDGDFGGSRQYLIGYKLSNLEYGDVLYFETKVKDHLEVISQISPNPATEYIEINVGEIHELLLQNILIFDIFGNKMHPPRPSGTPQEGNLRIDISTLPAGVYFVRIGNEKPLKFVKM